jgi:hypothetical protein
LPHRTPASRRGLLATLLFLGAVGLRRTWDLRASTARIPRGLVGRSGKVLGCRALLLLHDQHGHPLLATTHRGDRHLTAGAAALVARYERVGAPTRLGRLVVDREGLAAEFLAGLAAAGRDAVTVLRADQYAGPATFAAVGPLVPLRVDRAGAVVREVAPARFRLPRPERPDAPLGLTTALIRDLRRTMPAPSPAEDAQDAQDAEDEAADWYTVPPDWGGPDWQATPLPAAPTQPKLIPIVTTAPEADPVELARAYIGRWPAQENVIKDWLLPLGLDTNHGDAKAPVENSEVAKKRAALERRLANARCWASAARQRSDRAARRADRRWAAAKARRDVLQRELATLQIDLEAQGTDYYTRRDRVKARKDEIDEELRAGWAAAQRSSTQSDREYAKARRYCQDQRDVLRQLEDLAVVEEAMFELDNGKDQAMTALKLALANLGMWARDRSFPAAYAQATWARLAPFFRLPGRIIATAEVVRVEVRPFNDRALNRDLAALCERVAGAGPRLPDGRRLVLTVGGEAAVHPAPATLHAQEGRVA